MSLTGIQYWVSTGDMTSVRLESKQAADTSGFARPHNDHHPCCRQTRSTDGYSCGHSYHAGARGDTFGDQPEAAAGISDATISPSPPNFRCLKRD